MRTYKLFLAFSLILDFYLNYLSLFQVSFRVLHVITLIFIVFTKKESLKFPKELKTLFYIFFFFTVYELLIYQTAFYLISFLFNFILSTFIYYNLIVIIGKQSSLKIIYWVLLPTIFIGIFQGINMPYSWELREIIPDVSDIKDRIYLRDRVSGLAWYSLLLSYIIFMVRIIMISCNDTNKVIRVLLIIAALFTGTRSVIGGMIIIETYYLSKLRYKLVLIIIGLIILSVFAEDFDSLLRLKDASSISRIQSYITAFDVISDNLFIGIGAEYENYIELINKNYAIADDDFGNWEAMNQTSHNYLVNLIIIFGVPLGIYILTKLFRIFNKIKNKKMRLVILTAFILNMLTHNGGFTNLISFQIALIFIILWKPGKSQIS
jgi:hypothetical protein